MTVMRRFAIGFVVLVCASWSFSQSSAQAGSETSQPPNSTAANSGKAPAKSQVPAADEEPSNIPPDEAGSGSAEPPADDRNFSSSRETLIDISAPKDDRKEHPNSASAISRATEDDANGEAPDGSGVQEFHEWNPMRALKDVEVGDYYFKRKNYRAALDRYKEALVYKQDDAVATFRLAVCQEQMQDRAGALQNYAAYLKILPHGPFAEQAGASIERLGGPSPTTTASQKESAKEAEPAKP